VNWSTQLGIKLVFWLADVLIGDALGEHQRRELRNIATSFSVDAKFQKAA
jgi:hypothetical protein